MDKFIPIIAYHRVNDIEKDALAVNTKAFQAQMSYLKNKGYQTIHLDDLVTYRKNRFRLPEKPIVITFDDGFRDNYVNAYPIIKEYGFQATVFLIVDLVESDMTFKHNKIKSADSDFDKMLTWDQVKEMFQGGMEFGSHTCSHANLLNISQQQTELEILGSYSKFEQKTGYPPLFFCYPYGAFDPGIKALVEKAGFRGAVVTPNRYIEKEDLFTLFRVGIYGHNNLQTFKFKISRWFKYLQKKKWYWKLRT